MRSTPETKASIRARLRRSLAPRGVGMMRQRSSLSVWEDLALRVGAMVLLLGLIIAVHWFERDSFKDNADGAMSFADVIYFTMISATTTGYGDIVPITERARLFDALVVTPARIFFILILAGTAYSFMIRKSWDKWRMGKLQERLTNHIVVAGFGTSGSQAVAELVARGEDPRRVVVIDRDAAALEEAEAMGCIVFAADATRDQTMEAVRIRTARTMIVSAGRDDTSILICLTARHLNPSLPVSMAIREQDNEFPARAAGATTVINPVQLTGLLLAGSTHGAGIADYLTDLASADGRVRLHERPIEPFEVGKSLREASVGIGLRIVRGESVIGFWEPETEALVAGDRIIEVVPDHLFPRVPAG